MKNETIASVIESAATQFAGRTAFIENGEFTTFDAHIAQARHLAAALGTLGIGPGDRVAILSSTSRVYIAFWHAALLGHFTMMPLNTRLAAAELINIVDNADPAILLFDDSFADLAAAVGTGLTRKIPSALIADLNAISAPAPERVDVDPDTVSIIMFTSGTGGTPKGVEMTQSALAFFYRSADQFWDLKSEGARIYTSTPLYHISAAWSVLGPPLHGNTSVITEGFDMDRMIEDSRKYKLTHLSIIPTMLTQFYGNANFKAAEQSHIRYILCGGAPINPLTIRELLQILPNVNLLNMYGMTEAVGGLTFLGSEEFRQGGDRLRSCGLPMDGVEIRIRSSGGAVGSADEIGEIEVQTPALFKRYFRNPEATQAAIVDGWYRTGDIGRIDADGYLYLIDRLKDMIITGGENVYSQEVEQALLGLPGIAQAAVIGVPSEKWGEEVHAIVVPAAGVELSVATILTDLRKSIAGYKCPKAITITRDPLPMLGANKVNKRALREAYGTRAAS